MPAPRRIKTAYNARTKSGHTLKKKIRDAERLLSRPSLPADKKVETERALAAWKLELQDATKSRIEHKMDQKYRMVKFFGRLSRRSYDENWADFKQRERRSSANSAELGRRPQLARGKYRRTLRTAFTPRRSFSTTPYTTPRERCTSVYSRTWERTLREPRDGRKSRRISRGG